MAPGGAAGRLQQQLTHRGMPSAEEGAGEPFSAPAHYHHLWGSGASPVHGIRTNRVACFFLSKIGVSYFSVVLHMPNVPKRMLDLKSKKYRAAER